MAPTLSVVIPTFNEAANIGPILTELRRALAGVDVEFVVVDDDSRDGTADKARLAEPTARVIVRKGERGLATAVVRGLREAKGTFVAVMDADFQHPPAAVRAMFDRAMLTQADLVVGSRYAPGGSEGNFGFGRRTISKGARTIAKVALPPVRQFHLTDPMSGLFLVRRDRVDPMALRPSGYKILLEILGKSPLRRVEEVGYRFQDRRGGTSKLGSAVMLQYLIHVLGLGLQHKENQRLLRFVLVGASGVVVNLGLFWSLHNLVGFEATPALLIAIEVSILSNFFLNDAFTFRDRHAAPFFGRMGMFNLVSIGGLLVNFVVFFVLFYLLRFPDLTAAAIGIAAGFGVNYAGNLGFTYGSRRPAARRWVPILVLAVASTALYGSALDSVEDIYFDESYYLAVAHQMDAGIWIDPCPHDSGMDPTPLNYEHPPLAKLMMFAAVRAYDSFNADTDPINHGIFGGCRDPNCDPASNSGCVRKEVCYVLEDGTELTAGKPCFDAWVKDMRAKGNQYAWRGPSALMGVVTVVFAALAARRIFESNGAGILAGTFVLFDNLVLSSSRIALLDIFATGFMVVAVYFATFPTRRGLIAAAIALGLGFSCKFYVLFAGPPILILSLWTHWRAGVLRKPRLTLHLLAYPLIPVGVFLMTYMPWLILWTQQKGPGWAFGHFIGVQAAAIKWDTTGEQSHTYLSPPSEWLGVVTPMNYINVKIEHAVNGAVDHYSSRDIYALGNPVLWWAATIAALAVFVWLGTYLFLAIRNEARAAPAPSTASPAVARTVPSMASSVAPPRPALRVAPRPVMIPGAPPTPLVTSIRTTPAPPLPSRRAVRGVPAWLGIVACGLAAAVGVLTIFSGFAGLVKMPGLLAALAFVPGMPMFAIICILLGLGQVALAVCLVYGTATARALQALASVASAVLFVVIMVPSGIGINPGLGLLLLSHAAIVAILGGKAILAMGRPRQALVAGAFLPLLTFLGFFALHSGGRSMFLFYMTVVVPMMAIALAGVLAYLWRMSPFGKVGLAVVTVLIGLAFLWYLPVTLYLEVPRSGFQWMWLPIPGTPIALPYPGFGFHDIMGAVPWMHECGDRIAEGLHRCVP